MSQEEHDITGAIEGCPFPQWYLEQGNELGMWTPEEVTVVEAVLRPAMQEYTDQFGDYANNYWRVWKMVWDDGGTLFTACKATWEMSSYGGQTVEEIAQKIREYYSK